MASGRSEWAIVAAFSDGDCAYFSSVPFRPWTRFRGSSVRYESREAAKHVADSLKSGRWSVDVEEIFVPPRATT